MSLDNHIADNDLELYSLGRVTAESELAAFEEHILACPKCAIRAKEMQEYVATLRAALIAKPKG